MAEVQNPITGRSKNKYANAIFSTWKGRNILRSKPLSVANPQTDAQMKQRAKFSFLVHLGKVMQAYIRVGFKEVAVKVTAFNAFMSENMSNGAMVYSGGAWNIDPSKLTISKGSLDKTDVNIVQGFASTGSIELSWDIQPIGNQSSADKIYIYGGNINGSGQVFGDYYRNQGSCSITISGNHVLGDIVDLYIFFVSPDGRKVADTLNIEAEFDN